MATPTITLTSTQIINVPASTSLYLNWIACPAANQCLAVGNESTSTSEPVYSEESNGKWGAVSAITPLMNYPSVTVSGVSCVSSGNCVAVANGAGEAFLESEVGGGWQVPTVIALNNIRLKAISCPSIGNCVAVGQEGQLPIYLIESKGAWGTPVSIALKSGEGEFNAVTCTSTRDCVAVGVDGAVGSPAFPLEAVEVKGVWQPGIIQTPTGYGFFTGVSCPSPTDCVAVGATGFRESGGPSFYVDFSNSTWRAAHYFTMPASVNGILGPASDVSCASVGNCVVTNEGNLGYAVEFDGVWSSLVAYGTGPNASMVFYGVACPTLGPCTLIGSQPAGGLDQVFSLTADQAPLKTSVARQRATAGSEVKVSVAGGSGTSAPVVKVAGHGCSLRGTELGATGADTCVVTASTTASDYYSAQSAPAVTVTFKLASQRPLVIKTTSVSAGVMVTTSGGSGAGKITLSVSGASCAISGHRLSAKKGAHCVVTATKAAQGIFASTSASAKITFL